jgi:hypothetical protein
MSSPVFRSGRGYHQAQGRVCSDVSVLFEFTLPPPTLEEGKLEGFFAHFSLGQNYCDSGSTHA